VEFALVSNFTYGERGGFVHDYEARSLVVVGDLRPGFEVFTGRQQGLQGGRIDVPSADGCGNLVPVEGAAPDGGGQGQAKGRRQQKRRSQCVTFHHGVVSFEARLRDASKRLETRRWMGGARL